MTNTLPTVKLPGSGYEVRIRRQPGDMLKLIEASVRRDLKPEEPVPPTQRLEVAPNEFKEVEDLNNPEYVEAMDLHEAKFQDKFTQKMLDVIVKVGIADSPEIEEIAELRVLYDSLGIVVPEDDRTLWVQFVLAPSVEDFSHLTFEIFGRSLPTEAQVAFHRTLFPRNVETPSS